MRRSTTAAAGVLFAATLSLTVSGTAQAADRDCPDFASQAEAQAAYDAVAGDPERLDGDDDGEACEEFDYAPAGAPAPGAAPTPQIADRPAGSVAAGDGSSASDASSSLPYVLGGLALTGAGGAAFAARRTARTSA